MADKKGIRKRPLSPALKTLFVFNVFYVVFNLLLCMCLPLEGKMRTVWFAVQLAASAAAMLVWMTLALRRAGTLPEHSSGGFRNLIRPDTVLLFLWFGWGVVACLLRS